jgi:hypothetical protein
MRTYITMCVTLVLLVGLGIDLAEGKSQYIISNIHQIKPSVLKQIEGKLKPSTFNLEVQGYSIPGPEGKEGPQGTGKEGKPGQQGSPGPQGGAGVKCVSELPIDWSPTAFYLETCQGLKVGEGIVRFVIDPVNHLEYRCVNGDSTNGEGGNYCAKRPVQGFPGGAPPSEEIRVEKKLEEEHSGAFKSPQWELRH